MRTGAVPVRQSTRRRALHLQNENRAANSSDYYYRSEDCGTLRMSDMNNLCILSLFDVGSEMQ
jgi:hypothetical protein